MIPNRYKAMKHRDLLPRKNKQTTTKLKTRQIVFVSDASDRVHDLPKYRFRSSPYQLIFRCHH